MTEKTITVTTKLLPPSDEIQVYKKRWAILFLYCCCAAMSSFYWIEAAVIPAYSYYGIRGYYYFIGTDLTYVLPIIVFILPVTYLLQMRGLRITLLLGLILAAIGAWIRVLSVSRDRFHVLLISQIFEGLSGAFFFLIPPRLAAVWFGPNQVSTACGIGAMSLQAGQLISFLVVGVLLPHETAYNFIGLEKVMQILHLGTAAVSTVLLIFVFTLFTNEPPHSPSIAVVVSQGEQNNYRKSLGSILKNGNIWCLLFIYLFLTGTNLSLFQSFISIPDGYQDDFLLNMCLTFGLNVMGGIFSGILLDKTRRFKPASSAIYIFASLGILGYLICRIFMVPSLNLIRVFFLITEFFMGAYITIAYEYGVELTYPHPEGISSGIITMIYFLSHIIFGIVLRMFISNYANLVYGLSLCSLVVLGCLLTFCTKRKYKRQEAAYESCYILSKMDE